MIFPKWSKAKRALQRASIPTLGGFVACGVATALWASKLAPLWLAWLLGVTMGVGVNVGGFLGKRWWG